MGSTTGISWTDATWNCLRGCTRVSAECTNCYAEVMAARFAGPGQPYHGLARMVGGDARWTNTVRFIPEHLEDPLRWQQPKKIFVNSMSDVFHEQVTAEWLAQMWAVMALCPQHIFQILTKRPERMRPMLTHPLFYDQVRGAMAAIQGRRPHDKRIQHSAIPHPGQEPLPNVWMGTSTGTQAAVDSRVPHLLAAPAAIRFLSVEPLLEAVTLAAIPLPEEIDERWLDPLRGMQTWRARGGRGVESPYHGGARINWVIVGGESGAGYRPMDPAWARAVRDECVAAGTAFFYKQGSGLRPGTNAALDGVCYHAFPASAGIGKEAASHE